MSKALITFSNGEILEVRDGQLISTITQRIDENEEITVSHSPSYTLWNHTHDGLTTAICEMLCRCDFFSPSDSAKIYFSKSVVSIENI
ncbi:hypothetical protein [Clostridium sp. YIM B02506]|uniref:hypothetical protein n=1 Tax=Clostridium sp. YIM B02506 TaxID=2910680 RepID=UPI001EEED63C|nr:hypothetical protein [Clostridium sp. YIM B02506]